MKPLLLGAGALVVVGLGAGGWYALRPHDKMAQGVALAAKGDARGALLAMRSAVQGDPSRPEPHYRLGLLDLQLGDAIAAEKELVAARTAGWPAKDIALPLAQAVLAQNRYAEVLGSTQDAAKDATADIAPFLVVRAQAQLGLGRIPLAEAEIAEAQRLAPQSGSAALVGSKVAAAAGKPDAAEAAADRAAQLMPDAAAVRMQQAQLRIARKDLPGALRALDEASHAANGAPGLDVAVPLLRAWVLLELGDPRAGTDIDAVLAKQPRQPLGLFLRATRLAAAKDWRGADTALGALGANIDRMPRGQYLLAVVKYNMNQPSQALDAAEHAVARAPDDALVVQFLASLYMVRHQPEDAVRVLTRLPGAGQGDPATAALLADALADAGRAPQALQALSAASDRFPESRPLALKLAGQQMRAGNGRGAEDVLRRAVTAIPIALPATDDAPAKPTQADAQAAAALVLAALQAGDLEEASAGVARLRQLTGQTAGTFVLDGMVKMARLDSAGAKAAFEAALKADPNAQQARFDLARLALQDGDTGQAVSLLREVLAADPGNVQALQGLSAIYFAANRSSEAVSTLEAAHRAAPANAAVSVLLAEAYTRTGSAGSALPLLAEAEGSVPKGAPNAAQQLASILAARVRAQQAVGQRQDAIATALALVAQAPRDVALLSQTAGLQAAERDWDGALKTVTDGLKLLPGNASLLELQLRLTKDKSGVPAALALADRLAADPANAEAGPVLKGDLLRMAGRNEDAAAAYKANIKPGGSTVVVLRAADALASAGKTDEAASLLGSWVSRQPASSAALLALGALDLRAGKFEDARNHLQQGLAGQPQNAFGLNNYAWVLQRAGDLPAARQAANRAWLLAPTPEVSDTLGWIMVQMGDTQPALPLLRQAAAGMQGDPGVQYHLAEALKRNNQPQAARELLTRIVGQPGDFPDKQAAVALLNALPP